MRNLPVHWSEGMFLRPQHFQAAERHWSEIVQTSEQWDHAYNYGIRSIDISHEAIANHQVQVASCRARLKDGTLVMLEVGQEPDRVDLAEGLKKDAAVVDLAESFETDTTVRVYLAVPRLAMGRANVGGADDDGSPRYSPVTLSIQDESRGGNDQLVEHRGLNVKLLLSTQDLSGHEILPVAQISRAGQEQAAPELDELYIPPLLAIDCWPPLGRDIVRAIYDIIGRKIEILSEQVANRGITLASSEPGDLERVMMLSVLNGACAALGRLTFATGVHPFPTYVELCRIVGQLSIFAPERRTDDIPNYDHDDLGTIFRWVKRRIEELINAVRDYEYEQRFFIGAGMGMQVTLEPKWLGADWDWYVGVNRGSLPTADCHTLLSPGKLDWKMGSAQQVDLLFKNRAPGLQLSPLAHAPRALPAGGGWLYYEVGRQSAAWVDVQAKQTLAMRFKDELINNLDSLEGQRRLEVVTGDRPAILEFALFAVPKR